MNEVLTNILSRRSVRRYKEKQIPDEDLSIILEAAKYAPSGSNSQTWHFTVIQEKAILNRLNILVKTAYEEAVIDENTYVSIRNGKTASKSPDYNFFYKAPTLIIVSNDRRYPNAMADCACAIQNIFLASQSLGVGSCWINQLTWFGDTPMVRAYLTELGIPGDHKVCGSVALGYSEGSEPKPLPRKENLITIFKENH